MSNYKKKKKKKSKSMNISNLINSLDLKMDKHILVKNYQILSYNYQYRYLKIYTMLIKFCIDEKLL